MELLIDLDGETTKVYLGCDSQRVRRNGTYKVVYATVCIVHLNGNNGGKIFKHVETLPDYESDKTKPKLRLMNEAAKVCEMYLDILPIIQDYCIEIHLDINPDEKFASSHVARQAAGYVLGMTGIEPKLKPEALAASTGADYIAKHK